MVGLDVERFSTFRLGHAWPGRFKSVGHSFVALYNSREKRIFGTAKVERVVMGTVEEMIRDHSRQNHMVVRQKLSNEKAAEKLGKIAYQIYGPNFMKPEKNACVIYLRRR